MAAGFPDSQITYAAEIHFLGLESSRKKCAKAHDIPGMVDWCPMTLQDEGQLTNYYNQIVLDKVISDPSAHLELPNAIYIDAVSSNGCIRTGTQVFSSNNNEKIADHETTGFAYAYALILYNVLRACSNPSIDPDVCKSLTLTLKTARSKNPLSLWDDAQHGRLSNWP